MRFAVVTLPLSGGGGGGVVGGLVGVGVGEGIVVADGVDVATAGMDVAMSGGVGVETGTGMNVSGGIESIITTVASLIGQIKFSMLTKKF